MLEFSKIKNKKLQELIKNSLKFQYLSETDQQDQISKIAEFNEVQTEKIIEFFEKENAEDAKEIQSFYEELIELDKKLSKEMPKDAEKFDRSNESSKMDELMSELDAE